MARRFVRIDLSDEARDFRPVAIEPGVPMLDRSNATAGILFKWLGGLVAEPEWEAESVNFYVRDDHGGRLEQVACTPASDADLSGPLKGDLDAIKERIAKARPETSTEQAVHRVLSDSFTRLTEDEDRTDRDHYFFKYRDVQGRWRLVWCWGYQRADQQPADTMICTDPDCSMLFVRRPGQSAKCPGCEVLLAERAVERTSPRRGWLVAMILFVLVAAVVYGLLSRARLVATPEKWTGPVGSRVRFKVTRPGLFGFGTKDVSHEVHAEIFDPKVAHFDPSDCSAIARNPGRTVMRLRKGILAATVELTVLKAEKETPPQAVAAEPAAPDVVILSDQAPPVQFPVGAQFDDFRVEARYSDGFTRIVTKIATLTSPGQTQDSPVAFSDGRITGLKPGKTEVHAVFEGVRSQNGLQVEVTADTAVDEIRLRPSSIRIVPGETVTLDAVGYRGGKSVGVINGLGGLEWKSGQKQVVRVDGPAVTGLEPGQGVVTARLGSVTSAPAQVSVSESIADALVVNPDVLQMLVGESRHIGTDLVLLRGQTDLSRQADVTSAVPGVVQYVPETHSLKGVSPGVSAVTFTSGDKLATAMVEVLPAGKLQGEVLVEPHRATLAPGQSLPLRVYLLTSDGRRLDKTDSAALTSSAPETIAVRGNLACAVAPGSAEVSASLPEAELPGKASFTVEDDQITELILQPPRLDMSVGDLRRLRILGRAGGGIRELFPQPELKVTPGGSNPEAIEIVGPGQIAAVAPGNAEVTVSWADRLSRQLPVTVTDNPLTDLSIDPAEAAIPRGQPLVYRVTGMRGGRRLVLGPRDGVSLTVGDPDVAQIAEGLAIVGRRAGQTEVVARIGQQQATASLQVTPDEAPAAGAVVYGPDGERVWWPGYGYFGLGYDIIYGPGGVTSPERIRIEPPTVSCRVGQSTPAFSVIAQPVDGAPHKVPAVLESADENILVADPSSPGVFNARGLGRTQVRALYRNREAFATVTVTGQRFLDVTTTLNEGDEDFSVTVEVLAADSEGPLEYRVYLAGQTPPEQWVLNREQGDRRRAVLQSPRMTYGPPSARYSLVVEARAPGGGPVQRYPFTFRLAPRIERTDSPR